MGRLKLVCDDLKRRPVGLKNSEFEQTMVSKVKLWTLGGFPDISRKQIMALRHAVYLVTKYSVKVVVAFWYLSTYLASFN